jgi:peptidoglycan/xylan/chitin deacetylase (PgdA/CDA1 family)
MDALRWLALRMVERPEPDSRRVRFFYQINAMEYWRGVQEAGGVPRPRPLRVLAYHAIADLPGSSVVTPFGVPPGLFRRQIEHLRRAGVHFVSPTEFAHFLRRGGGLPPRPMLLTFDDAYKDLLEIRGFLADRGIPGVVFAVSGRLGGSNAWDEALGAPSLPLLDANDLRLLAEAGLEVGAHSRTHRPLTQLSETDLVDEIAGSVAELQAAGLPRPRMFAYPEGAFDERVKDQTQAAGLEATFTTLPGLVRPGQNPHEVPRIEIMRDDSGWRFLWKVFRAGRWKTGARAAT